MIDCPCPCGAADLKTEPSLGFLTIADVICEYRTCRACKSTRPFIHPIEIEGQKIRLYHDPLATEPWTSEGPTDSADTHSWDNLLDAIEQPPLADVAELRREGIVLARAFCAIDGVIGWKVLSPLET